MTFFGPDNARTILSQRLSGLLGAYTLSFHYAREEIGGDETCTFFVQIDRNDITVVDINSSSPTTFTKREMQFEAPGESALLELWLFCSSRSTGRVAVDAVEVRSSLDGTAGCKP